ncbi:MAG TPA: hypothetical protein VHG08_04310 [Longimicrobium sp.]|nr:hypothetical protein [Longimicrobium sp.]
MTTRIATAAIRTAMAVAGVLLVFDVLYYLHGSLEMVPSEEDHRKIRLVTGFVGFVLALTEILLWLLLRRLRRTRMASAGGGAA